MFRKKINTLKLSAALSAVFFVLSLLPGSALAQTSYVPENGGISISGSLKTRGGNAYRQAVVAYIKDSASGLVKEIYRTNSGKLEILNLDPGVWRLELYWESDLMNPSISPQPLYTFGFTLGGGQVVMGDIILPDKEKCPKGQSYYYTGTGGRCIAPTLKPADMTADSLESLVIAYLNYYRKKSKLPPLQKSDDLKGFLDSHVSEMATYNYVSVTNREGCNTICRFNKYPGLLSAPNTTAIMFYTYDKIYKESGAPARYVTEYKVAKKIVSKLNYGRVKKYDAYEIGIEIRNNRIFVYGGGMMEYTDNEITSIANLVNSLTAGISSAGEKAQRIHDWITANIAYDKNKKFYSHYGPYAWRNRIAVCDGYSELFRYMMGLAGVDAPLISGWAKNKHAWNKISVSGTDYYIDTTWDAGYMQKGKFVFDQSHDYFLIPYECIKVDHYTDKREKVRDKKGYVLDNGNFFEANCPGLLDKYLTF